SGRVVVAVWNVGVEVVDGRRNPDGRDAEAGEVGHLLLDAGEVAAPVETPVGLRRVVEAGGLRGVVVGRRAVEEAVGDDLVDDLALEVGRAYGGSERDERDEKRGEEDVHPGWAAHGETPSGCAPLSCVWGTVESG